MPVSPFESFEYSWNRADYLLRLYSLLFSTSKNKLAKNWETRFKRSKVVYWNDGDELIKIKGAPADDALFVIRNPSSLNWTKEHFKEKWLSELLCASLVFSVSAMDRYFHDLIVKNILTVLKRNEIPRALGKFKIPLTTAEDIAQKAFDAKKENKKAQLRTILKDKFREELHRVTFQAYDEINDAFSYLGLEVSWKKVAQQLQCQPGQIKKKLGSIIDRRNKIVHEADVVRTKRPRRTKKHEIDLNETNSDIHWIHTLVEAINNTVQQELS